MRSSSLCSVLFPLCAILQFHWSVGKISLLYTVVLVRLPPFLEAFQGGKRVFLLPFPRNFSSFFSFVLFLFSHSLAASLLDFGLWRPALRHGCRDTGDVWLNVCFRTLPALSRRAVTRVQGVEWESRSESENFQTLRSTSRSSGNFLLQLSHPNFLTPPLPYRLSSVSNDVTG